MRKDMGYKKILRRSIYALIFLLIILVWILAGKFTESPAELILTDAEKTWLANHPEIIVASEVYFYPFEFFDENGFYRGVGADYIALLEERLGIRFEPLRIETDSQLLAKIKSGEIDIVGAVTPDSIVTPYMLPLQPHIIMPGVLVSKEKNLKLKNLTGQKVVIVSGCQWESLIAETYPDIELTVVPDESTGLKLVSSGVATGLISDIATASYYIHREGLTDIGISGYVGQNLELGIAVRKDWPELRTILGKALASISSAEKKEISLQWIHLKKSTLLQSKTFRDSVITGFIAILLVMVSVIIWNRTLNKEVTQRTRELNEELRLRREAEADIKSSHDKLIVSHQMLRKTQAELIHVAKMRAIGMLAAGIAHEVKNPLTVLRFGLDFFEAYSESKNEDSMGIVLGDMENALERAGLVVNRLLDFSREDKPGSYRVAINEIIESSLHMVDHEIKQRNILLVKELEPQLPLITFDKNKVQQVFINLFMNAVQAIGRDGTLSIFTSHAIASGIESPDYMKNSLRGGEKIVVVEIVDTGPGISGADMEKVFDPFYTTKPSGEGTGLGLFIIKNIMDLHNGKINIKNLEAGGLSVTVMFRCDPSQEV